MKNLFLTKTRWLVTIILLTALGSGNAWGANVTWEQVAWDDITTSDVFIITITNSSGTTYLMNSANGKDGTPKLGYTGTLNAEKTKCTFSENDDVKWKKDSQNRLCMATDAGKWIYTNSSNNALRVGTGTTGNTWSLDGNYIKSNASRYLSLYGTTDFRSYTSKQSGQVTRFFKAASCTTSPTVAAASNSSVTATTATVSCSGGITHLGNGCSISSYGFVIGTSADPEIGGSGVTQHEVGTTYTSTEVSFSKDLTGLTAETTYYVRPYATNGNGTAYGTQTSFTTSALPKYTVTLKDDGDTRTQASAGASVTLPVRAGCAGYTFAGWTKTWVATQTSWTTTAPDIIPAGSYTPEADENLYPVYTKTEDGGGSTTKSYGWEDADDATNWTISGIEKYDTYKNTGSYSGKIARGSAGESTIAFKDKVKVTSFSFQFLRQTTNNNYNVRIETSSDGSSWDVVEKYNMSAFSTQGTWYAKSHSFDGKTALYVRFVCYTTTAVRWVDDISITYVGGSTTSYISVPNCCTELGSINGSISWTNPTTAVLTWDNIDHVSSWAASCIVHGGSSAGSVGSITTNGEGKKTCTVTGLSCNTNYDFTISATAASGYYDKSQTIENENSGTWSVTSTITNGTKTSVPTTACGDYTATFAASSGFHFPAKGDITVIGAKDFGWNSSTGELTISGANITGDITISITCPADACTDAFSLHTGTKSGSDWLYNKCFSDADWGAVDDAIWSGEFPSTNECYVGWAGGNSYHGAYWAVGGIKTYDIPNGRTLGWNSGNYYQDYPATAIGTFHIYKTSQDANYYLRFKPTSYVLRTGSDGTSWTSRDMTVSGVNAHYYESEFVTLTSTIISEHAYVDLKANNVNGHVWCNFSNDRVASGNVKVKNGASTFRATDLQAADNGTYGKFQIDITQDVDNWKLAFVPYYRITYNANGGTGSITASSYVEVGSTAAAAANGFTAPTGKQFGGWAISSAHATAGTVDYAASASVTLNSNVELFAVWTDIDYTVTVNQSPAAGATTTGQTSNAHYNGTINLTTTVPDGYRFVNWTSSEVTITNPTSATTASFTMPAKDVTVTANFVQTHTVTWKVSGKADNEVVYDHGYALVLPSNPSAPIACSEKRFVGWKEGAIDGSTDVRPTMLNPSNPGIVTADKTYYAVFADEGTTFTKVTDPSTFMAGDKIAIVSNDNSYGLRISSNAPAATASTIPNDATITPAADQVFTLGGNSTDGFTMSTASRTSEGAVTLGAASVPNSNASANVSLNSSNNTWKFSAHNTSNCILISPSSKSTCGLEYYKSSWKIYTNSGVASTAACAMRVYRKDLSGYVTTCSECMTPSDLEVSAITSTGATVTWTGVSQTQQVGGSGTGYKVAWNTSNSVPSPLNASNSADVAAGTNSYAITGLTAATQYYVFVQSKCDDSWSSSTNFYTNAKITYAAGAGSGSMDSKEVTYNTDATVDACTFTAPSGKKFNGWVSDQSVTVGASSTTSVPEGATITGLTKAITLTAQWRDLANYTVNFSADNGTVAGGTAQTVYEEGRLTFPNVTSTTCGTFIGWVEAASYDDTAAPSGATFHEAGSQIDVVAELDGKTYYAVYRVATGMATNINDELTADKIGTTSYSDWSNLVAASAAIYAGNSTKSTTYSNSIQIRNSNSSGIVTTTSGGLAKKVTFNWVSGNTSGRIVDIYGKNSAYSSAADLYSADAATQGTKIGSITYNSTTELTISTDYEYIGIRANNGAAYIGSITIQWYGAPMKYQTSPTCSPMVGVESSFSTFTYAYNAGPSASQSFTISGSNLGADLVVTAPENYEVCKTADGTYTSTIRYTSSDGAVANTTAYIRLAAGLNVGTYNYAAASGLQVTSTGAKTRTAALNGSVTKADCAITFTDFNAVDHYEATLEYGSSVTVSYNYTYNGDGSFSISRSPATGTIDKANKTLTVSVAGIWTLKASATAGTNYSKPSDASAQIRVKCVDTYKDFIHNKTIKAYGSGTAVTDGKMEDWGSGYTVPYIDDNAIETSGSCQQTHYKFMGWVSEDDINIADGTFKTGWTLIQAGTASKPATTKTYYAVWAKLEE